MKRQIALLAILAALLAGVSLLSQPYLAARGESAPILPPLSVHSNATRSQMPVHLTVARSTRYSSVMIQSICVPRKIR